jgi:hypothetical protein
MSTAYHPQTDGQTECVNQELEQYLHAYTSLHQDDWADFLPLAEFAHNSCIHSTTKVSPFKALMGYDPNPLPSSLPDSSNPTVSHRLDQLICLRTDLESTQQLAHQTWRSTSTPVPYKVRDEVWLEGSHLSTLVPSLKLALCHYSPFKITKAINNVTFQLQLPLTWKPTLHLVFHASLLSPYCVTPSHGPTFPHPPPDLLPDASVEYEVEKILDSRFYRHGCNRPSLQYLVHWLSYPASEDTWEPVAHLTNASSSIAAFHWRYPSKPSPTSSPTPGPQQRGHRST